MIKDTRTFQMVKTHRKKQKKKKNNGNRKMV